MERGARMVDTAAHAATLRPMACSSERFVDGLNMLRACRRANLVHNTSTSDAASVAHAIWSNYTQRHLQRLRDER
jgi:hypothetical protein